MKMYHYSKIEIKEVDFSKCDNGFFATSISPDMLAEHGDDIGFDSNNFCMTLEIDDDSDYELVDQETAEAEIEYAEADYGLLRYDNGEIEYEDAVFFNNNAIKSITAKAI
jgi:hypothetical protein